MRSTERPFIRLLTLFCFAQSDSICFDYTVLAGTRQLEPKPDLFAHHHPFSCAGKPNEEVCRRSWQRQAMCSKRKKREQMNEKSICSLGLAEQQGFEPWQPCGSTRFRVFTVSRYLREPHRRYHTKPEDENRPVYDEKEVKLSNIQSGCGFEPILKKFLKTAHRKDFREILGRLERYRKDHLTL